LFLLVWAAGVLLVWVGGGVGGLVVARAGYEVETHV